MKYLKQFLLILCITFVGELVKYVLPLPIPASIYGMVILFVGLMTGHIKLSSAAKAELRNQKLGFIYQFHHLLPDFTALENVAMPLLIGKKKPAEINSRALEMLKAVGLEHRANHRPSELSGGERQRVAIARALVNNPRLVLADEPTGNLDARNADSIFQLLGELNRLQGTAFLVVTHDLQLAKRMSRQLEMRDGRLTAELSLMGAE